MTEDARHSACRGLFQQAVRLLLAILAAIPCAAQNTTLDGQVTNSATGDAIPRAHVTLFNNSRKYGAFTDAAGNFSFGNVVPDSYQMRTERAGFRPRLDSGDEETNSVKLLPGVRHDSLNLKLTPLGSIAGRVLDADGEPMDGVFVAANRGFISYPGQTTDEKGRFRILGVEPGKYRIRAVRDDAPLPPEIRTDGTVEVHYASTWYPGVLDQKSGASVEVRPGSETGGIEIRMVAVPVVGIRGRIEGLPSGFQDLWTTATREGESIRSLEAQAAPDGTFELWRLDPGHYRISASGSTAPGHQFRTTVEEVDLAGSSVNNLALTVVSPLDISGHLEFEDAQTKQKLAMPQVALYALHEEEGNSYVGRMAEDGSFRLDSVLPGRYRVRMNGDGAYIKSMRLGQREIEGSVLDLRHAAAGAELFLTVSSAMGSLSGTVRDEKGAPSKAWVALIQADFDYGGTFTLSFPVTSATDDGMYSFNGIVPGKYRVIALDKRTFVEPSAYDDVAEEIEIRAGEKSSRDLTRQAADR